MQITNRDREFISSTFQQITKLQTEQVVNRQGHVEIFGQQRMAEMYKRASVRRLEIVQKLGTPSSYSDALSIKSCIERLDRVIGQQEQG